MLASKGDVNQVAQSLVVAHCGIDMQDELKLGNQAITRHTQLPSQTYRLQLSPEMLDPLCHGLGHAIYRLAFSMQHSAQLAPVADIPGGPMQRQLVSNLEPALGVITGRLAYSVSESECSLIAHTQPADLCYRVHLHTELALCLR